jgi:flavin-dependent dehydrogenase
MTITLVDALIIGAGPAGTTAAALLAESGMKVVIVEKDEFPRFKIGESLLPCGNAILKRLGIWDKMDEAGFIRKYGAEFVSNDGETRVHNIFSEGLIEGLDYSYQVERSRFDQLLLQNAIDKGATVLQPCRVSRAQFNGNIWQVNVKTAEGQAIYQTHWLLDASGRNAFIGNNQQIPKDNIPYPKRFAVYNHFENVKRNEGKEAGNIVITRLKDGWFWSIPITDTKTSVGVVSARERPQKGFNQEDYFNQMISTSPFLSNLMEEATPLGQFRLSADYTYSFNEYASPRCLLIGDAAGFIDPIFSSGVYLAMLSASKAADLIIKTHTQNRYLSHIDCKNYTKQLKKNVRVMRDLIEVYYDPKRFSVFMSPSSRFKLFQAVNAIVAGNSNPSFSLKWRFKLFLLICRLNKIFKLAPDQNVA